MTGEILWWPAVLPGNIRIFLRRTLDGRAPDRICARIAMSGDYPPACTRRPRLARDGAALRCDLGAWMSGMGDLYVRVRWLRDGRAIGGATDSIYWPSKQDAGAMIGCAVTAHNEAGQSEARAEGIIWEVP